eukprot:30926-Pelagococcus_subviridis.AAC.8
MSTLGSRAGDLAVSPRWLCGSTPACARVVEARDARCARRGWRADPAARRAGVAHRAPNVADDAIGRGFRRSNASPSGAPPIRFEPREDLSRAARPFPARALPRSLARGGRARDASARWLHARGAVACGGGGSDVRRRPLFKLSGFTFRGVRAALFRPPILIGAG